MRRPWLAAIGAALLVAGCAGSGPASDPSSGQSTPSAAASPSGRGLAAAVDIERAGAARVQVPGGMDWIVTAGDSAWTSNEALTQLDGESGAVVSTLPLAGATCLAPDVGFGSVWVGVCGTPQVLRVDPRTGKVVARIRLKAVDLLEESSVAAGAGGVWVLTSSLELIRIDPRTNTVARTVAAPDGASAIRATADALWVTDHLHSQLLRIDPRTLEVVAKVPVGAGPQFLAVGMGQVWTLNQSDGSVTRVDPATNRAAATIPVDTGVVDGGDIAVGGGYVWARVTDGLVAKIDPHSNSVVARYGPGMGSGSVAAGRTAAWVTAHDSNTVFRLPLP